MPDPVHTLVRLRIRRALGLALLAGAAALASCQSAGSASMSNAQALAALAKEPLTTETWSFTSQPGTVIRSQNYRIYTTIDDPLFQHLLVRVLEAAHDRVTTLVPNAKIPPPNGLLDCYVFSSRGQWEAYTRARAGSNAPIYLQISAGGYCQEGVFAGYDIGRDQTLSVVAHEAWHQYSWFAFKDRLPSWLEEGLATQNEAIDWQGGTTPVFRPELNWRRFAALRQSVRDNHLWKLSDLLSTHAGRVIKLPQYSIDAYYAQLWSLVLFLERTPAYQTKLKSLLADASAGKLTQALNGTDVTRGEIDNFTEHWNSVAGPVYLQKYLNPDIAALEQEYLAYIRKFTSTWPPSANP